MRTIHEYNEMIELLYTAIAERETQIQRRNPQDDDENYNDYYKRMTLLEDEDEQLQELKAIKTQVIDAGLDTITFQLGVVERVP